MSDWSIISPSFSFFCLLLSILPFVYFMSFLFCEVCQVTGNLYCNSIVAYLSSCVSILHSPLDGCWRWNLILPQVPALVTVGTGCRAGASPQVPHSVVCFLQALWEQRGGWLRGVLVAAVPVHQRHDEQPIRAHSQGEGRCHHARPGSGSSPLGWQTLSHECSLGLRAVNAHLLSPQVTELLLISLLCSRGVLSVLYINSGKFIKVSLPANLSGHLAPEIVGGMLRWMEL